MIEDIYQNIGHLALENAPKLHGKLLIYAEVQDGVIESAIFYERGEERIVTFKFCTDELEERIYELWELWRDIPGNTAWYGLAYFIENRKLQIELTYPEQVNSQEGMIDRRQRVCDKYFDKKKIDFSKPQPSYQTGQE